MGLIMKNGVPYNGSDVTRAYVDQQDALKVDKVAGKGLSTNDYDDTEKGKVAEAAISASATGTSFALTDAANGNLQNLVVKGRTDSATAASVGDNGLMVETRGSRNRLKVSNNTQTLFGITFTVNREEGSVTLNGTAEKAFQYYLDVEGTELPAGDYVLDANDKTNILRMGVLETDEYVWATNNPNYYFTLSQPTKVTTRINIDNASTHSNRVIKPLLYTKSEYDADPTYEPYKGSSATITTGLPFCSLSESVYDELDMVSGVVRKKAISEDLGSYTWSRDAESGLFYTMTEPSNSPAPVDGGYDVICGEYSCYKGLPENQPDETITFNNNYFSSYTRRIFVKDSRYSDASTFRTAVTGKKLVYQLATPYDAPLTPAEITVLTNLKTYTGTTNISCTDSPIMTVGYLLNTDNGQSAADMQVNILHALAAVSPKQHRMIFRGKCLGTSPVTVAELADVKDGSFRDKFIGDYWFVNNIHWRLADMDFLLHCGDTPLERHHLVIVPDEGLVTAPMNDSDTTAGGYYGSAMHNSGGGLDQAASVIVSAFPLSVIVTYDSYLTNQVSSNGYPNGASIYRSTVELLNENMVYGHREHSAVNNGSNEPTLHTFNKTQLALFQIAPEFITTGYRYWLQDVVSLTNFADVHATGYSDKAPASNGSRKVRPFFVIG